MDLIIMEKTKNIMWTLKLLDEEHCIAKVLLAGA